MDSKTAIKCCKLRRNLQKLRRNDWDSRFNSVGIMLNCKYSLLFVAVLVHVLRIQQGLPCLFTNSRCRVYCLIAYDIFRIQGFSIFLRSFNNLFHLLKLHNCVHLKHILFKISVRQNIWYCEYQTIFR